MLDLISQNLSVAQELQPVAQQSDTSTPSVSVPLTPATKFLREARLMYQTRTVVSAQVSEDILILDKRIVGMGSYKEKIDDTKRFLRIDMNYSNEKSEFGIRYIADGDKNIFWIVKNMEENKEVMRVDLFKLTEQTANPDFVASFDNVPITPISLGGIPYLLSQMERNYLFDNYHVEKNEQTGEKYHIIEGVWNPKRFPFPQFVSENGSIAWEAVPVELPDSVKIYFDEQTLFPCRIHYYRTIKGKSVLITKIRYYNVSFNVRLLPQQFSFDSPGRPPMDITSHYLKNPE